MSNTLFRNIMDLDLYGLLCMPTTLGIPNNIEKSSDGIRRVPYEPDNVTNAKPFAIQPANTGTLPASVMSNAKDYLDELANQPSGLLRGEAPGRVDSSAGLGMLMETSNTSIMPSAQNEADAVSHCYKYMLGHIRKTWNDQDLVSVAMLDDSIAGIGIDISTGKMELSSNAIPHPDKVKIGIASSSPTSKQQDVMSLSEQLSAGIITPMEYRITIREKNLPVEVCNEQEWQNYRRAVLENIQQYGDGLVPNKIIVTDIDLHEVHLMVLDRFMAKPEFLLASKEVRAAFKAHRDRHLAGLGIMPEGAEFLEDAAQEFIDYNQYNEQNVATQPDMQNQGQDGAMMGDDINNYEQEQDMY